MLERWFVPFKVKINLTTKSNGGIEVPLPIEG